MKKLIKVTKDDISKGKPRANNRCPIARAIKRILPNWEFIEIGREYMTYGILPRQRVELNQRAKCFIDQFDDGKKVKSFSFYLDIPTT